ncbi:MAG: hypothetical protein R3F34_06540 [Planctomycetota bacterium]
MQYPKVAAIVVVGEGDVLHLDRAMAEIRAQRGLVPEIVLVDTTRAGDLEGRSFAGATLVETNLPSRGLALRRGARRPTPRSCSSGTCARPTAANTSCASCAPSPPSPKRRS